MSQTLDAVLHKGQTMPEKNRFPAVLQPIVYPFDTTQITSPGNYSNPKPGDACHPLAAGDHRPAIINVTVTGEIIWAVRRVMPVECERLQGFPDGWTLVPTGPKRKPAADGPRYKQLGNSMATHVMFWIGARIARSLAGIGHNGGPPLDEFEAMLG